MVKRLIIGVMVPAAAAGALLAYRVLAPGPDAGVSYEQPRAASPAPSSSVSPVALAPSVKVTTEPLVPRITAVSWELIQQSTGDYQQERRFPEALHVLHGKEVSLVGFIVPLEDHAEVRSFMVLPFPTCCYYCAAPGPTEVLYLELDEEPQVGLDGLTPVEIRGTLFLYDEPEEEFLLGLLGGKVRPAGE